MNKVLKHNLLGLVIFVGGLILAVLLFAFYIFPNIICKFITTSDEVPRGTVTNLKDPMKGFCLAVGSI